MPAQLNSVAALAGGAHASRLFARATPVFAAEHVDNYQVPVLNAPPATVITPIEQAEAFVADIRDVGLFPAWGDGDP